MENRDGKQKIAYTPSEMFFMLKKLFQSKGEIERIIEVPRETLEKDLFGIIMK